MSYRANTQFNKSITISGSTGAAVNADGAVTATLIRNGSIDSSVTLAVTNIQTGVYNISGTIPQGYTAGDNLSVLIGATVGGIDTKGVESIGVIDRGLDGSQIVPMIGNAPNSVFDCLNGGRAAGFGAQKLIGNQYLIYGADGTTVARTYTIDDVNAPTQRV